MASDGAGKFKLLFLMSRDFGELTNAIYLAMEQEFESLLLVPPLLYNAHQGGLPVATHSYKSIQDVIAAADREKPDIVFLFSGYLYANNGVFPNEDLEELVRALRERRCRIATSDPFLGLAARMDENTFSRKNIQTELFARAYAILKPFPHVYDVDPKGFVTTEALSFSNRGMVRPPAYMPCPPEVKQALGLDPSRKRWVFVLAFEDYQLMIENGGTRFDDFLTDQLFEALHQGRQPVLVAPPECAAAVARRSFTETQLLGLARSYRDQHPGIDPEKEASSVVVGKEGWGKVSQEVRNATGGLVLVPFCRHDWFMSLILDAEYAFYWNIFSNSLLVRAMNQLPVFFFDLGHIARASTKLFHRGSECYYVAGAPSCLDVTQPIEASQLARRAVEQEGTLRAMAENLRKSPAPAEMVRKLMQAR